MRATKIVCILLALCIVFMAAGRASAGAVNVSVPVPRINVPRVDVQSSVPKISVPTSVVPRVVVPRLNVQSSVPKVRVPTSVVPKLNVQSRGVRADYTQSGSGKHKDPAYRLISPGLEQQRNPPGNVNSQQAQPGGAPSDSGGASGQARYYAPASYSSNPTACGHYPYPRCN
jgi:hypothetical protein